jgi:hypothetical protein
MRASAGALLVVVWLMACSGSPTPYAAYRQTSAQEVPGTWGLTLAPPGDGEIRISPERAVKIAMWGGTPPGAVLESLATVPSSWVSTDGHRGADPTAWVVVIRNLCFASQKGELVSSSRRDPRNVERCDEHDLWATVIDPRTGTTLSSTSGYDLSGRWAPAVGAG